MKYFESKPAAEVLTSPPARGAWIEILLVLLMFPCCHRRPPHGGRGLKSTLGTLRYHTH